MVTENEIEQAIEALLAISNQFVCPRDTLFASVCEMLQEYCNLRGEHESVKMQCMMAAAQRDWLVANLQWCNVNTGQGYVLQGVGSFRSLQQKLRQAGAEALNG